MRLKRLRLQNFRIHKDTEIDFGDAAFVVFWGKNGSGKSSIVEGISLSFTPTTTGLDPKGTGFQRKIKRGESKATLESDTQTRNHLIRRTVVLNSNSTGRSQHSVCLSDPNFNISTFDKHLEKHRAALQVALNTDAFLGMDEDRQKNLLAGLVLPARYDWDREVVSAVESVLGLDANAIRFEDEPFAVITRAYKKLFDERQIVNRQVRDFQIPEPLATSTNVDAAGLEEQLTAARAERAKRVEERERAVADANRAEVGRERVKARRESLEREITEEQRKEARARESLVPDDRMAYLKKVVAGKDELERLGEKKQEQERTVNDYLKQMGHLEDMLPAGMMPVSGMACPTCEQRIDEERVKALAARLDTGLKQARDEHLETVARIKALGNIKEALETIGGHEKAARELEESALRVSNKRHALEEFALPETIPFDFQPYDRSIAECEAEVERLSGVLRPVIAAEFRRKEIAILKGQLAGLKEKAALLDRLVKYFDKDGIKARLLGEYIGGFERKINEVMEAWGFTCALSIDPYSFDVTNALGDTNPVGELSGAERKMFSGGLQCAVSRTANIGLVVIDEADRLLPELRSAMNKRLYEMVQAGYLEQVIIMVAEASEKAPSLLPGMAVYLVRPGSVVKLAASPSGQKVA